MMNIVTNNRMKINWFRTYAITPGNASILLAAARMAVLPAA